MIIDFIDDEDAGSEVEEQWTKREGVSRKEPIVSQVEQNGRLLSCG